MRSIITIITLFFLGGCSSIKEAQTVSDNPNCRSIVEIFYSADTTYTTRPPLLLLKRDEDFSGSRFLYGGIGSISDSGIVLIRSKKSKYFPYEKIQCLIDSNNQIAFGKWKRDPEVIWEISLRCRKTNIPNAEPFIIILIPNQVSSYCIESGEYEILNINFIYNGDYQYLDVSDSLNNYRFKVNNDAITYIGSLHSEYKWNLSSDMVLIPTKIVRYKSQGYYPNLGLLGALAVGLIEEDRAKNRQKLSCSHGLRIRIDSNYAPISSNKLPLIMSPIYIGGQAP
jgi:hypothetical protein